MWIIVFSAEKAEEEEHSSYQAALWEGWSLQEKADPICCPIINTLRSFSDVSFK